MAERLAATLPPGGADHALILNNLGAVPPIEMGVIAHAVLRSALAPRIRLMLGPGPYMTALNMNGFSLSLLKLDPAREAALTAAAGAAGLDRPGGPAAGRRRPASPWPPTRPRRRRARTRRSPPAIRAACERLIALEPELNRLDARAGDGDTGSTAAAGARSLIAALPALPLADPAATCRRIGDILSASMGGSSGVLLSIFFTATGQKLAEGAAARRGARARASRASASTAAPRRATAP